MREIPARFSSCFPCAHSVKSDGFWKGGGSPRARARGGKSELRRARCRVTQARSAGIDAGGTFQSVSTDSATEKKPPLRLGVSVARVKRWGKSPPLQERSRRHGKPHREQGQIGDPGAARSISRFGGTGLGYWLLRQMILSPAQAGQTKFGLQPFQNLLSESY